MADKKTDPIRPLAGALYLVAFLLVLFPLVDLALNFWPFAPNQVEWRYGSVGLLSGFVLTPLLGIVLAVLVAHGLGHMGVMRGLSWLNLSAAVVFGLIITMFILDSVQMRANVPQQGLFVFDVGVVRALLKNGTTALALGWIGLVGRKSSSTRGKQKQKEDVELVVSGWARPNRPTLPEGRPAHR